MSTDLPLELWQAHILRGLTPIDILALACTSHDGSRLMMRCWGRRIRKRQSIALFPLRYVGRDIDVWLDVVIRSGPSLGQLAWLRAMRLFPRNIWRTCKPRRYQPLPFLLRHKHLFKRCDVVYPLMEAIDVGVSRTEAESDAWLCSLFNVASLVDLPAGLRYALLVVVVLPRNRKELFPQFQSLFWLLRTRTSDFCHVGYASYRPCLNPPCGILAPPREWSSISNPIILTWRGAFMSGDGATIDWIADMMGKEKSEFVICWDAFAIPPTLPAQTILDLCRRGKRPDESLLRLVAIQRRDAQLGKLLGDERMKKTPPHRSILCSQHGYNCQYYQDSKAFLQENGWWSVTEELERQAMTEDALQRLADLTRMIQLTQAIVDTPFH